MSKLVTTLAIAAIAIALLLPPVAAESPAAPPTDRSRDLYDRFCLACHGTYGDGQGPAMPWLWPRPRDFTIGEYKWRTTRGAATDADLAAAIRYGVAETSMHAFAAALGEADIDALVTLVKSFAADAFEEPGEAVVFTTPPTVDAALMGRGKAVYAVACLSCHGDGGVGDGPSADTLKSIDGLPTPPFDLTSYPLRRPRPNANDGSRDDGLAAIYAGLTTGIPGSGMPAYVDIPDGDLWAVSAFIDGLRFRSRPDGGRDQTILDELAIQLDYDNDRSKIGYWPGHGDADESAIMGATIPFQGEPLPTLAPAQASIDADRCARCHAAQHRDWQATFHAAASSPGLLGQVSRLGKRQDRAESCQRCHAPLAEQLPFIRPGHRGGDDGDDNAASYIANPALDPGLRSQGVSCAVCHVRGWRRFGPPPAPDSRLLSLPGYPFTVAPIYQRADFCLPCHQLPPTSAVARRPLLNTYVEWLQSPYMSLGVQCQHCHMPNREHTWKGVHDPDTFRQAIAVEAIAARSPKSNVVSVRARVSNVGAGHYVPTTATPMAWLTIELVDDQGEPIAGAYAKQRIGRHIVYDYASKSFKDLGDTRIPPARSIELARAWKKGRVAAATAARVRVRVVPDDYYTRLYQRRLDQQKLTAEARAYFTRALARSQQSEYIAVERLIPL